MAASSKVHTIIYPWHDKMRLDRFLLSNYQPVPQWWSRNNIQKIITTAVLVNNKEAKKSYYLKYHDVVTIAITNELITKEPDTTIIAQPVQFEIIYEDDDLLVINKPNNLVVHPGAGNKDNTLLNGLQYRYQQHAAIISLPRLGLIHRLDKQTTGLLLIAKNQQSFHILITMMKDRAIKRKYLTLVEGIITEQHGKIIAPLARDPHNRLRFTVAAKNSKEAITKFTVVRRMPEKNKTLVKCKLETGRTHQIRVHLQYIDHPIYNDPLYYHKKQHHPQNNDQQNFGQYLHAYYLQFKHPCRDEQMIFFCNLPVQFQNMIL